MALLQEQNAMLVHDLWMLTNSSPLPTEPSSLCSMVPSISHNRNRDDQGSRNSPFVSLDER